MMTYIWVGLAGMIGALGRYYLGLAVTFGWIGGFPVGTLLANLIGCFVLGWFTTFVVQRHIIQPQLATAISTGLIGSFTTFSTFSIETVQLITSAHWLSAGLYLLLSIGGGLLLAGWGYQAGKRMTKKQVFPS